MLQLYRPTKEMLLRQCCRIIRQHKFQEIASRDQIAALKYLQTELASTIDHKNDEETKEVCVCFSYGSSEIIVIISRVYINYVFFSFSCLLAVCSKINQERLKVSIREILYKSLFEKKKKIHFRKKKVHLI